MLADQIVLLLRVIAPTHENESDRVVMIQPREGKIEDQPEEIAAAVHCTDHGNVEAVIESKDVKELVKRCGRR
jgi:hypothetical protein